MISVIVQARIGSTRLKNKVLQNLKGDTVIDWILSRVSQCKKADKFILAIPDTKENEVLEVIGETYGFHIYKGSENDVLSRFYQAALEFDSEYIVRICADNPVVSGSEIDHLINFYMDNMELDYVYNHIPINNLYPDGLGGEMVSFDLLETVFLKAKCKVHREHIFNYIWDNQQKFKIGTFDPPDPYLHHPDLELDIDTLEELEWFRQLPIKADMNIKEIITAVLKQNAQ